jgi:hypothetical protein
VTDLSEADVRRLTDTSRDPVVTDGDKYKVMLENERVRVLEYRDTPGQRTTPHFHADYVMVALSSFKRKLTLSGGREVFVEVKSGHVTWGAAQCHVGENVGDTDTHVLIVELKKG